MDNNFIKLQAQVTGLELVTKTLVSMTLMSSVKDEADLTRASELAGEFAQRLQQQINALRMQAPPTLRDSDVADLMFVEMQRVVATCFEGAGATFDQIAKVALDVATPATPTKN